MGFYSDTLSAIQAAISARLAGDAVDAYRLPDGSEITNCSLETLFKLEERFAVKAQEEAGTSRITLARTRPRE